MGRYNSLYCSFVSSVNFSIPRTAPGNRQNKNRHSHLADMGLELVFSDCWVLLSPLHLSDVAEVR